MGNAKGGADIICAKSRSSSEAEAAAVKDLFRCAPFVNA